MEVIKTPYLQGGRELCVTGCAVLFRGNDLLDEAIEHWGGLSHCACVVRQDECMDDGRVPLIEALGGGLTPTFLEDDAQGYDGHVYLFTPAGLTPAIQHKFRSWLLIKTHERTPYGYGGLFGNMVGHVQENAKEPFCSEAWGLAIEQAPIPRLPQYQNNLAPRPGDVPVWWPSKGPMVELIGPFKEGA
jgi:hypothetical protein